MNRLLESRPFVLISVVLSASLIAAGQKSSTPKRIELKAGAPAIVLEGEVVKGRDVEYVFSGKAGQKFAGRFTRKDGNTGFEVTDPDGQALPEEEFDFNTSLKGTLEKTGEYKIMVATFETKPSKYALAVRITDK